MSAREFSKSPTAKDIGKSLFKLHERVWDYLYRVVDMSRSECDRGADVVVRSPTPGVLWGALRAVVMADGRDDDEPAMALPWVVARARIVRVRAFLVAHGMEAPARKAPPGGTQS